MIRNKQQGRHNQHQLHTSDTQIQTHRIEIYTVLLTGLDLLPHPP